MILEVRNAFFHFKNQAPILKNINFTLKTGEVLCILGPNGVGKTTLIKAITGLLDWNSGASYIDGENIKNITARSLWSQISYIPQKRSFSFSYTGIEMVVLGLSTSIGDFSSPGKRELEKAALIMETLGIAKLANKDCSLMSGGELQMVLIARALISEPKLIILDEPESGLDFRNQLKILDLIKRLTNEKGIICIMNTHYPNHALEIANKILLLDYNNDYKLGETDKILTEENIRKAFFVDVIIENISRRNKNYKIILPIEIIEE